MSDEPVFDGLLEKYAREDFEALIAYQAHHLTRGIEALLREAADGY